MTDTPMPDEWEEHTLRMKKDPEWPHHGTDIEFNGVRYTRADLHPADASLLEALNLAYKYVHKDTSCIGKADAATIRQALAQHERNRGKG